MGNPFVHVELMSARSGLGQNLTFGPVVVCTSVLRSRKEQMTPNALDPKLGQALAI